MTNEWQNELRLRQRKGPSEFLNWLLSPEGRIVPEHIRMVYIDLARARTLNIRKNYENE